MNMIISNYLTQFFLKYEDLTGDDQEPAAPDVFKVTKSKGKTKKGKKGDGGDTDNEGRPNFLTPRDQQIYVSFLRVLICLHFYMS
jgi:hypothetical protein